MSHGWTLSQNVRGWPLIIWGVVRISANEFFFFCRTSERIFFSICTTPPSRWLMVVPLWILWRAGQTRTALLLTVMGSKYAVHKIVTVWLKWKCLSIQAPPASGILKFFCSNVAYMLQTLPPWECCSYIEWFSRESAERQTDTDTDTHTQTGPILLPRPRRWRGR